MAHASNDCLVLLGVDGSDHSVYAFDWYVHNFHRPGNKLLLVHVPEPNSNIALKSSTKLQDQMQHWEIKLAAMQGRYMDKMKVRQIDGEFLRLSHKTPGQAIVECALEKQATFVVIGTRGQSKVRRTIMGSVSDYIVHNCHAPVLLCRHRSGWEKQFKSQEKKDRKELKRMSVSSQISAQAQAQSQSQAQSQVQSQAQSQSQIYTKM
jgi:nucleotide-binding universal stress UspA family protein